MTPRPVLAALFFVASVPVCAGIAAGAVYLGDVLLSDTVLYSCEKRGLVIGLLGVWGTVLFGFLMGQVDWVATRLAPQSVSAPTYRTPHPRHARRSVTARRRTW